jgi:hypothetical protein
MSSGVVQTKDRTEDAMRLTKFATMFVVLATLAACGGHHGEIFHQDRPGGTDFNAAQQGKK